MVDLQRILASPDISTLRDAVAAAFDEISLEQSNAEKIEAIDARLKILEAAP